MLPHYSFVSVLLHSLPLCLSVCTGSVLLYCLHHVDLPLMTFNQYHDVTHTCIIYGDTIVLPFKFIKHDVIDVDPLLKCSSVLMLDLQILISSPSMYSYNFV